MAQDEKWEEISTALKGKGLPFQYKTVVEHNGHAVTIDMDLDPGGGFEGGFEFTVLTAPVPVQFTSLSAKVSDNDFRFALHDEKGLDRIGKFFGMEDVKLGYDELDRHVIIKTNNKDVAREVFSDPETRQVFSTLKDFSLQLTGDEEMNLELMIDRLVDDPLELRSIFEAYISVLEKLKKPGI